MRDPNRPCPAAGFACTAATLGLLFAGSLFAAPPARVAANDLGFERAAKGVPHGEKLVVDGLLLDKQKGTSTLELERIQVWRPDAVVMIDGQRVPAPKAVYFRGTIDGDPFSQVLLSVREKGGVMGLAFKGDGAWAIGKGRGKGALRSKKANPDLLKRPFECGLDRLPNGGRVEDPFEADAAIAALAENTVPDETLDATIAIETDFEYYNMPAFAPDETETRAEKALNYMGDLIGYLDLVYSREIDTDMFIGFSRLWTTSDDPWASTSDSGAALTQFINYWNANMQNVPRTVAHMLSGRETGGGVAYVGVLCDAFGSPGGNLSYGYSGTLDGNFSWDGNQANDPANVVWDIMVVAHEIGHNYNSPHAHDYCGIDNNPSPIDRCYQGCAGAAQGLPSCSGPTPFFDGGPGTIMSYCHLVGGMSAISMTFGGRTGALHTCGTAPERQATRMRAHVTSRAASYPQCFAAATCGNGELDAGEECDPSVTLTETCADQGFVGGTLSCTSSCTFNTSQCHDCGNNVIDAGEVCDGTDLDEKDCSDFSCTGGGELGCNATCSGFDRGLCLVCPPCTVNGVCNDGESCSGCPEDCDGGSTPGAVCGNGLCEAGNGEDCASCPSDCRGVQGGKPQNRYCCGDGGGSNPVTCSDARCTSSGFSCTTIQTGPGEYCCGDDTCSNGESCANCALDCALGAEVCGNGADDNCNGFTDCADSACSALPSCTCRPSGQSCTSSSQCCSNNCRTKGKNANTCA